MAHWIKGDTVVDYITLVDGEGNVVTGADWSVVDALDPDELAFDLFVSEIGGGVYKAYFTSSKSGHYYWSISTTNLVSNQTYEADFSVDNVDSTTSPTSPIVVFTQSSAGVSLNELIRMLATRLGDFLEIKATNNGSADGTSFVDIHRLAAIPSQGLSGSSLTFISPSNSVNFQQESRIVESSEDTQTLTLNPPLPTQVVVGDIAWITNIHSEGYYKNQYVNAINSAIQRAWPNHMVPLTYVHDSVWDPNTPWITLPNSVKKIYGIQAYDDEPNLFAVPMSFQNRGDLPGWWFDSANKRLVINEPYRGSLSGQTIRVLGYGRPAALVDGTDVTSVDAEWIVDMGYEELKHAKGDQRELAAASMGRNIADMNRGKIATIAIPGTIDIG